MGLWLPPEKRFIQHAHGAGGGAKLAIHTIDMNCTGCCLCECQYCTKGTGVSVFRVVVTGIPNWNGTYDVPFCNDWNQPIGKCNKGNENTSFQGCIYSLPVDNACGPNPHVMVLFIVGFAVQVQVLLVDDIVPDFVCQPASDYAAFEAFFFSSVPFDCDEAFGAPLATFMTANASSCDATGGTVTVQKQS